MTLTNARCERGELRLSTKPSCRFADVTKIPSKRFQEDFRAPHLEIEFTQSEEAYQDVLKGRAERYYHAFNKKNFVDWSHYQFGLDPWLVSSSKRSSSGLI